MKKQRIIQTGWMAVTALALSSCIKEDKNTSEGTPGEMVTLQTLRWAQQQRGGDITVGTDNLNGGSKITGVVISDKAGMNVDANSFVLQQNVVTPNTFSDVTRGVVVKMNAAPAYNVGDSIMISVVGARLGRENGKLTLSGITADKVSIIATGKTPLSRAVTTGVLNENMDSYESTLVTINADIADYAAGSTFNGLKRLNDNGAGNIYAHTMSGATVATATLPMGAQIGGIAGYYNEGSADTTGARKVIMPRNAGDIQFASGMLYANWPESFESPDPTAKSSYNSGTNNVDLKTGSWNLLQGIIANTAGSDRYNVPGRQSIRIQQNLTTNGFVQMNFDVPGASKVSVFYGRYGSDARTTFRLEASTNGGTTWTAIGSTINVPADKEFRQAVWTVNYTSNVRFRINKLGSGTSNNGRLNIDDFAIYR